MSLAVPEPGGAAVAIPTSGASALVEWAQAAQAAHSLAEPLARTDFVPQHFRGNAAAATAAILYGAEVGLSPMQALQNIYVISGRPALYSRTMLALALAAGHEAHVEESTEQRAVVVGKRRGSSHEERVVVTMDQARKAGWTSNKKYASEPATMLLARAQSQLVRRIAPDALVGMAYSVEEVEDDNPTTVTVARAETTPQVKRTVKRAAAPTPPEPELDDPPAETGELITDAQMRKLHALLNEKGMADRSLGLAFMVDVLGREVESSKTLTKDEASRVIDALDKEPTPAANVDDELWPEPAVVPA